MFDPQIKRNIRLVSGIIAAVIFVFYVSFILIFKIVPTITSIGVTFVIIYVFYSVAVHWKKTPRKFGSTLLSIGIFLMILALLFNSFAEREEEVYDALLIEGFYAGFEEQVGLNITKDQLVMILQECTPENKSLICDSYNQAKKELDTAFDQMVDTNLPANVTSPIVQQLADRYLKKASIKDVLAFDDLYHTNKNIGQLFILFGLIFFCVSWFAERSYEKLAKSLSAVLFFSVVSVFVTYKVIELVFLWIPDKVELVRTLLIEIVKIQSKTLIWPMILLGIVWIGVNIGFIWYYYPKRKGAKSSGLS